MNFILHTSAFILQQTTSSRPVAVVTGASSGLGAAIARSMAQQGYAVVLAARRAEQLEALAGEIRGGGVALAVPTDMCDPTQIDALAEQTLAQFGRVDVLVNNAGANTRQRAYNPSDEQIATIFGTNVYGPMRLTRALLPRMLEQRRGHVINIGSVVAHIATPGNSLYAASKHALRAWNDSLRREVAHKGIRVSLLSPGYIRTDMTMGMRGIPMPGPQVVATAVLRLLRRPRREVVVPGVYRVAIWAANLLPPLADALLGRMRR
ncbi:MAG: SDR family oxidoreductase [Chloroflexaceae bacterium]|nr:SDR family oxidoreductase [Chloroflexaceae bacterium]